MHSYINNINEAFDILTCAKDFYHRHYLHDYLESGAMHFIWAQRFHYQIKMALILYKNLYRKDIQLMEKRLFKVSKFFSWIIEKQFILLIIRESEEKQFNNVFFNSKIITSFASQFHLSKIILIKKQQEVTTFNKGQA